MKRAKDAGRKFQDLVDLLATLRGPDGCPWDREQDARSITNYFLEEVYEAVDALSRGDAAAIAEELGDVLMEVVFLSRLYEEKRAFSVSDALDGINRKMVRRHPHVFGTAKAGTAGRVIEAWVERKKAEKKRDSHFEGIAASAPALLASFEIGQRVSQYGFDWPTPAEALEKVREEVGELEAAMATRRTRTIAEEVGDCLFALANVARLLRLNPEVALRRANQKFIRRFAKLEKRLQARGRNLGQATLAEMDAAWEDVK